ncbi:MAG: flagellar basal body rod protein FlgB [Nitrospinota bacterium]|nr:flagellar basal body rod protein FlgB [Nitrospinota bacterium]
MNIFGLESRALKVAERSLDLVSKSTMAVTSNIANSETPGYTAMKVEFEKNFDRALSSGSNPDIGRGGMLLTDPKHIPLSGIEDVQGMVDSVKTGERIDGNTVNLDEEITALKELNLKYSLYSNISGMELGRLKEAIK